MDSTSCIVFNKTHKIGFKVIAFTWLSQKLRNYNILNFNITNLAMVKQYNFYFLRTNTSRYLATAKVRAECKDGYDDVKMVQHDDSFTNSERRRPIHDDVKMTLFKLLSMQCADSLKRYCLKSLSLKKWEFLELIKRCSKPCSTIPLMRKNRLNPFGLRTIDNLAFRNSVTSEKDDLAKILAEYQTSRYLFCEKWKRNIKSLPFLMPPKFKTQGCQSYGVKRIKSIFADKWNNVGEQGLGTSLLPQVVFISSMKPITSSTSLSKLMYKWSNIVCSTMSETKLVFKLRYTNNGQKLKGRCVLYQNSEFKY